LHAQALEAGERAVERNAQLFAWLLRFEEALMREDFTLVDEEVVRDKIANSPAVL